MNNTFRVSKLGTVALIWTIMYALGFLYFAWSVGSVLAAGRVPVLFDLGAAIVLLGLLVYGWLRAVKGYSVADGNLVVLRNGLGNIVIPLDKILSAVYKPDVGSFFNLGFLSIGGLFGWASRVRVRHPTDIESSQAEVYGTDPKKSVVINLESGSTIIVTPDDPEALVAALRKAAPATAAPPTMGSRARKGRRR